MPIRRQLRSFWWFIEGRVGGMGRLGYNRCHWFDLSFEEGEVLSWLGKQHGAISALADLWHYLDQHGPKAATFYGLQPGEETSAVRVLACLLENGLLLEQDWAYQPSWFSRGLPGAAFERSPSDAPVRCFSHDAPPGRSPTVTFTPDSVRFCACAWPWEP